MNKIPYFEQVRRQQRWENFNKNILPFLAFEYETSNPDGNSYKVLDTPKGDLMVYPKGDKILIIKQKRWIKSDISDWLLKFVIKVNANTKI